VISNSIAGSAEQSTIVSAELPCAVHWIVRRALITYSLWQGPPPVLKVSHAAADYEEVGMKLQFEPQINTK